MAQLVAEEGLGLDVVSGGELYVALRAGFPAERIHMHGNAKPRAELEQALAAGIGKIVVDTLDELDLLAQLTAGRAAPQAICCAWRRISPPIRTPICETGQRRLEVRPAARRRWTPPPRGSLAAPGLRLAGLHAHLGSQIFDYAPIARAIGVLLDCAARLRDRHGIAVDEISPGGGLGTPYTADQPRARCGRLCGRDRRRRWRRAARRAGLPLAAAGDRAGPLDRRARRRGAL